MKGTASFLGDIEQIRSRARQHIERGAVVEGYEADREVVLQLLNEALATELVCTLRYLRHYHTVRGIHAEPIASEFLEHAKDEQRHAEQIAERIVQLGGEPNYDPEGLLSRSHSQYVEGENLLEMVREDLVAERIAIESYGAVARYLGDKDPTSRRLMEDLLAKEEEHANDLADILSDLLPAEEEEKSGHEAGEVDVGGAPADLGAGGPGDIAPAFQPGSGLSPGESAPLPQDVGYGPSHGYDPGHGGPSGPGDVPAPNSPPARP